MDPADDRLDERSIDDAVDRASQLVPHRLPTCRFTTARGKGVSRSGPRPRERRASGHATEEKRAGRLAGLASALGVHRPPSEPPSSNRAEGSGVTSGTLVALCSRRRPGNRSDWHRKSCGGLTCRCRSARRRGRGPPRDPRHRRVVESTPTPSAVRRRRAPAWEARPQPDVL